MELVITENLLMGESNVVSVVEELNKLAKEKHYTTLSYTYQMSENGKGFTIIQVIDEEVSELDVQRVQGSAEFLLRSGFSIDLTEERLESFYKAQYSRSFIQAVVCYAYREWKLQTMKEAQ